jgi:ElaB/YqjD/DUF883 family membrane-anchored ribosome-binding protein
MTETLDAVASNEKVAADLNQLIAEGDVLLQATAQDVSDKAADLRARLAVSLHAAREKLAETDAAVRAKTREVARATDTYVHENPWKAIGVAAGAGLVIGLLIGRR